MNIRHILIFSLFIILVMFVVAKKYRILDRSKPKETFEDAIYYFDNNATTFLHSAALKAINQAINSSLGNSESLHDLGYNSRILVDKAREAIFTALSVNSTTHTVLFTSGATEANNLVLRSFCDTHSNALIMIGATEHSSVYETAKVLSDLGKCSVINISVNNNGIVSLNLIEEIIKNNANKNILVSVQHSNSETGVIQPINDIAEIAESVEQLYWEKLVFDML